MVKEAFFFFFFGANLTENLTIIPYCLRLLEYLFLLEITVNSIEMCPGEIEQQDGLQSLTYLGIQHQLINYSKNHSFLYKRNDVWWAFSILKYKICRRKYN